jgi:hypothetical protein
MITFVDEITIHVNQQASNGTTRTYHCDTYVKTVINAVTHICLYTSWYEEHVALSA